MSAAFLSSASSTMRRARSSGGRSPAGAAALAARAGRRRSAGAVSVGQRDRSRSVDPPVVRRSGHGRPVQRMVADIGGDRIRDEVAHRAPGGDPASDLAYAETRRCGPVEEPTRVARRPGSGLDPGAVRSGIEPSRGTTASAASPRTRSGSRQVGRPANASADRMRASGSAMPAPRERLDRVDRVRRPARARPRCG